MFYFYLQSHFLQRLLNSPRPCDHTPLSYIHLRRTQLQKVSKIYYLYILLKYLQLSIQVVEQNVFKRFLKVTFKFLYIIQKAKDQDKNLKGYF